MSSIGMLRPACARSRPGGDAAASGLTQWLTAAVLVQAVALGWLGASLRDRPAPR